MVMDSPAKINCTLTPRFTKGLVVEAASTKNEDDGRNVKVGRCKKRRVTFAETDEIEVTRSYLDDDSEGDGGGDAYGSRMHNRSMKIKSSLWYNTQDLENFRKRDDELCYRVVQCGLHPTFVENLYGESIRGLEPWIPHQYKQMMSLPIKTTVHGARNNVVTASIVWSQTYNSNSKDDRMIGYKQRRSDKRNAALHEKEQDFGGGLNSNENKCMIAHTMYGTGRGNCRRQNDSMVDKNTEIELVLSQQEELRHEHNQMISKKKDILIQRHMDSSATASTYAVEMAAGDRKSVLMEEDENIKHIDCATEMRTPLAITEQESSSTSFNGSYQDHPSTSLSTSSSTTYCSRFWSSSKSRSLKFIFGSTSCGNGDWHYNHNNRSYTTGRRNDGTSSCNDDDDDCRDDGHEQEANEDGNRRQRRSAASTKGSTISNYIMI